LVDRAVYKRVRARVACYKARSIEGIVGPRDSPNGAIETRPEDRHSVMKETPSAIEVVDVLSRLLVLFPDLFPLGIVAAELLVGGARRWLASSGVRVFHLLYEIIGRQEGVVGPAGDPVDVLGHEVNLLQGRVIVAPKLRRDLDEVTAWVLRGDGIGVLDRPVIIRARARNSVHVVVDLFDNLAEIVVVGLVDNGRGIGCLERLALSCVALLPDERRAARCGGRIPQRTACHEVSAVCPVVYVLHLPVGRVIPISHVLRTSTPTCSNS